VATIGGLSSATTYKFQIVANSSGGASMPATASLTTAASTVTGGGGSVEPLPVTPSAPSAPSQVAAVASSGAGSTSAVISFVPAPATSVGTTFTVTAFVNGVATLLTARGTASPITIQGLTPGVAYTFKVTASNSGGTSVPSTGSATITIPVKNTDSSTSDKPTKNPSVVKTASLKIYFESNSWAVNAKSRKDIQAFVAAMKKRVGPFTIKVVGMVEPTRLQPISVSQLSKSRANSVARLLKAADLKGKYEIKGGGLSTFRGPKSRYTQIVVTWKS
jgi:outer membrane protein OmpA-like peptidoglycan-associated protein